MRIKTADAIGLAMIAVGVVMTVFLFVAMRRPPNEIQDFSIHEIPSPPQVAPMSPHNNGI